MRSPRECVWVDKMPSSGAWHHPEVGEVEAWAKGRGRAVKGVGGRPEDCGALEFKERKWLRSQASCGHAVVQELGVSALAVVSDP